MNRSSSGPPGTAAAARNRQIVAWSGIRFPVAIRNAASVRHRSSIRREDRSACR